MAAAAAPDALGLLPSLHQSAAVAAPAPAGARPQRPWDSWGLPRGGRDAGKGPGGRKLTGLRWQVSADLASLGVSLVAPTREMAYLQAAGLRVQLAGTAAHLVLDLELRRLQASPLPALLLRSSASLTGCAVACSW